ncbi:MAG: hypothetical protein K2X82_28690 [Gemmataceae bacterium]|nr:hypothetical protein [Gemmataceae bacterium]
MRPSYRLAALAALVLALPLAVGCGSSSSSSTYDKDKAKEMMEKMSGGLSNKGMPGGGGTGKR